MKSFSIQSLNSHIDSRGSFTRTFDAQKLDFEVVQSNISLNPIKSTLRGLHFQVSGPPEEKLICVLSGSVFMVLIDLRSDSPEFLQKTQVEITKALVDSVYVPAGFATGWVSTSPNTTLQYLMSARYEDCTYGGIRYDDEKLGIEWPTQPTLISEQDKSWPSAAELFNL